MVKLTRADQLKLEAYKKKKSIPFEYKSVDFYDTDILGKIPDISKPIAEKQKPENTTVEKDRKYDLDFHENFCS
jgi:hypothetical protein